MQLGAKVIATDYVLPTKIKYDCPFSAKSPKKNMIVLFQRNRQKKITWE
jgi:hypothetical protein